MLLGIITVLSLLSAVGSCLACGAFWGLGWLWVLPVSFVGSFLGWAILWFLFLCVLAALSDPKKPQEQDNKLYRVAVNLTTRAARTILRMRLHTEGLEKLPKDGRYMLVCNHIHILDPITLLGVLPQAQLAFISKQENGSMFLVGKIMHKILCQPINRENDREALKTILRCIQIIKEDKASVGVFPEGYTSLDGLLHPFRSGAFKIAQKANVPIVVCTLQNTNKVFSNITKGKATDVHLHLVDVIPAEELKGVTAVEVGDRVHKLMADDLGPALVLQEEE